MAELTRIQQYMKDRRRVLLDDGRTGKIIRLDTAYPGHKTTVSLWTESHEGPREAKVDIRRVVGLAPQEATA